MGDAFKEYIRLVFRHWWAVVISYAVSGFALVALIWAQITVAGWVWGAFAIGGLAISQFLAFCDVRTARDGLAARRVKQEHLDTLATMRSEAISKILNARLGPELNLESLTSIHDEWMARVMAYLEAHFSLADRLKFERIGLIREMPSFGHAHHPAHARMIGHFAIRLERLEKIIDLYSQRISG